MPSIDLQYPRLSVSVTVPESIVPAVRENFSAAIAREAPSHPDLTFRVTAEPGGLSLGAGSRPLGVFPATAELIFFLEETLENALIERLDDWVGFHAGAAAAGRLTIVVAGLPDTGKTTSMFQLAEAGLELMCEEVTPVDPATRTVHPFPHPLTLDRAYVEQHLARYPVEHGSLSYHGTAMARYAPARRRADPAPLSAIVLPAFDPACEPALEETRAALVLTDLLQCCFPPAHGDERLFDGVIRIAESCRTFRLRSRDIGSARKLLRDLVALLTQSA